MKNLLMIMILLVIFASSISAQTWWIYPELGNAAPTAIIETQDGYVHTGGSFNVPGGGCYLAQTNKTTGALDWYRYFPSTVNDQSWGDDLVQTPDGGLAVLAADGIVPPYFGNAFWLIRTNSLGETLWTRGIIPPPIPPPNQANRGVSHPYYLVLFSPDSGFLMAGRGYEVSGAIIDRGVTMIRTNKNGETLWTRFNVGHETNYLKSDIRGLETKNDKIYLLGEAEIRLPIGVAVALAEDVFNFLPLILNQLTFFY